MAVKRSKARKVKKAVRIPAKLAPLLVPMDELRLWDKNPRHNTASAEQLAGVIREHGFRIPIVVDEEGVIRAGNTRYKAARLLGMKEIPAVQQEFLSEEAATAFALADNKAGEWATWDDDLLSELLGAKSFEGYRGKTGFNKAEIDGILGEADIEKLNKVTKTSEQIRDRVIIVACDAPQRDMVKEMLLKWINAKGLKGLEVK